MRDFFNVRKNRKLLNKILVRKSDLNYNILRRNYLPHDAIEGQMKEVKEVGRQRRQIFDILRKRGRYWELGEEAENQNKRWKR